MKISYNYHIFCSIQENFLKALIYYEDLNYEKITEEPLYDVSNI